MERVEQNEYEVQWQTRFTYHAGLKSLFAACRDPLPSEMEHFLKRLENLEEDRADAD